jgi:LacI family transcriptional regulator
MSVSSRSPDCTIGVMLPHNANPFFAELARGIEEAAANLGYTVFLCNGENGADGESACIQLLMSRKVAGVVFVPSLNASTAFRGVDMRRFPMVVIDRDIPGAPLDCVLTDHEAGAQMATEHLIALGHRRIACLAGVEEMPISVDRINGYKSAMMSAGFKPQAELLVYGGFHAQGGFDATYKLLLGDHPPSAIFASNDLMAIGALSAAHALGVRVPDELSIVGYDDISLASFTSPPLTTVAQQKYQIGCLSTEMLIERIDNPGLSPRRRMLGSNLVLRSSTAPFRTSLN